MTITQKQFDELYRLGMAYYILHRQAHIPREENPVFFMEAKIVLTRLADRLDALKLGVVGQYFFERQSSSLMKEIKKKAKLPFKVSELSSSRSTLFKDLEGYNTFLIEKLNNELKTTFTTSLASLDEKPYDLFYHYGVVTGPQMMGGAALSIVCIALSSSFLQPYFTLLFCGAMLGGLVLGSGIGKTISEASFLTSTRVLGIMQSVSNVSPNLF